jgi:protein TonB
MWSLPAALDLRGASLLGVGHFTVPPDVISPPTADSNVPPPWSTVRTLVVPHDIIAVQRRSPIKARKRTPWNPSSEPHGVVERGGSREWFTDRLFVEPQQTNVPVACSTSAVVHAALLILVLLLLAADAARAAKADVTPRRLTSVSLRMPVMASPMPVTVTPPLTPKPITPSVQAARPRPAPMPARTIEAPAAAPLDTPSSIEPEPTTLDDSPIEGIVAGAQIGGTPDGAPGGVPGGTGSGSSAEPAQPVAAGPFRVGEVIDRPRKIKDVKPVYPKPAMAARVGGNVLIEATIGVDGKVRSTRVLQSIGVLDQAALDAVRQWEFEPARLNGVPVAVTMVVVVTFALL